MLGGGGILEEREIGRVGVGVVVGTCYRKFTKPNGPADNSH